MAKNPKLQVLLGLLSKKDAREILKDLHGTAASIVVKKLSA